MINRNTDIKKVVVVYLEDILIFSENTREHKTRLPEVLQLLREESLKQTASKYAVEQEVSEFAGFRWTVKVSTPRNRGCERQLTDQTSNW